MPDEVDSQIGVWRRGLPELTVDELKGFTGDPVYALTLTDHSVPEDQKKVVFFQQPHGHEPSQTAGAMEVLSELITGEMLDGRPTQLDVSTILSRVVAVINPLGNPDGRARTPTEAFDDSFTFIEGAYYWNGKLRDDEWWFHNPQTSRFNHSDYDFDRTTP